MTHRKKQAKKTMAQKADKYVCYEKSVQCVEAEMDFVERVYKKRHGKRPSLIREDFCGTFAACCEFVNRRKENRAIGVDLDPEPLGWGRAHNLPNVKHAPERVALYQDNVLSVQTPPVEAVLGMNFSYFIFKERAILAEYFRAAQNALQPGGLLILDAYGGYEAQQELCETKHFKKFDYIWDQNKYNPITGEVLNHIHFHFKDGSKMKKAFTYDWRLWSLRELTELLQEVGFASADVYWEGWDDEEETGNGVFRKKTKAENTAGWVAYIVAQKA